jgi:hypothetical protein
MYRREIQIYLLRTYYFTMYDVPRYLINELIKHYAMKV